jgi:IS5 family transposase
VVPRWIVHGQGPFHVLGRIHSEGYLTVSPARNSAHRINAVLAAASYNFGLLLRWLAELLRAIIRAFAETVPAQKIA